MVSKAENRGETRFALARRQWLSIPAAPRQRHPARVNGCALAQSHEMDRRRNPTADKALAIGCVWVRNRKGAWLLAQCRNRQSQSLAPQTETRSVFALACS